MDIWQQSSLSHKKTTFQCHVCLLHSSVPSKVKNIHISNDGQSSSLRVNWTPGQGDVDRYSVSLSHVTGQAEERSVPKHVNEMSFHSLLPGQQYMITITSVSGSLSNNSTAAGRTGMHHCILNYIGAKYLTYYDRMKAIHGNNVPW